MLFIVLLLTYLTGCVVTLDLILIIEKIKMIEYSRKDKLYLVSRSWYSAIVLNSLLND